MSRPLCSQMSLLPNWSVCAQSSECLFHLWTYAPVRLAQRNTRSQTPPPDLKTSAELALRENDQSTEYWFHSPSTCWRRCGRLREPRRTAARVHRTRDAHRAGTRRRAPSCGPNQRFGSLSLNEKIVIVHANSCALSNTNTTEPKCSNLSQAVNIDTNH